VPTPTISGPRTNQLVLVGLSAGAAAMSWIACIGAYLAYIHLQMPREVGSILLAVAVTASLFCGQLWHAYSTMKAEARNGAAIAEALGQLAAEMEQLSEKVGRIDPLEIYTAVASDLLGQDHK
jgi:hypothetical protein